ncbi:translation initiation factor if-2-related [Holotrichia oblita]|uniref:Translation initiation factor if-2-related n=1 Tax=Holotrichia oblita TaxID=644536 RepID=A0ACB9T744_HOLOL|nr:translation initiation factor if-2-related [Holotrichia oblita]
MYVVYFRGKPVTEGDNDVIDKNEEKIKKPSKTKQEKEKVAADNSDDEVIAVTKVAKTFALLEVDSGPEVESDHNESDSETIVVKKGNKKTSNKVSENDNRTKDQTGAKKGKKNRKKKDDSDEDIDEILAELRMEYSGVKNESSDVKPESTVEEEDGSEKKGKPAKVDKQKSVEKEVKLEEKEADKDGEEKDEEGGTVKTAAQKKKEKKEREKQKKLASKKLQKKPDDKDDEKEVPEEEKVKSVVETKVDVKAEDKDMDKEGDEDEGEKESKKKKKKGKVEEKDAKDAKRGPNKKTIAAMQEALKKLKEEEERLKKEEEERIIREEEAEKARLEQIRLEQERKEKKRKKEKERKERLKAEGKLLTSKQKADRARAQAMIDNLKAQGLELPDVGVRKPRLGTRVKPNKKAVGNGEKEMEGESKLEEELPKEEEKPTEIEIVENVPEKQEEEEDVKDAWDADSSGEEESEETSVLESGVSEAKDTSKTELEAVPDDENEESSSDEEDEDDSDDEDDSADSEREDHQTDAERRRAKALARIEERKVEAEKSRTIENLRAAIVCVLGHVDTGKTKILDKLRRTNVQDGEAGGITQQIGATNVPIDAIKENIRFVKGATDMLLKIPGLLIIDTPGHESFSNLRSRGSSLCDIAILVVDIMHGLEPQTIESINLLKKRKTPFVVALNKIDRLYDWQTMNRKDVRDIIRGQAANTQLEFEERTKQVTLQFAEQGLNAALFYENPDVRSYISLVPTSAVTGEGMGNLLQLIVEYSQNMLAKRLMYSDELQATVLEVKAIPGLGTTIDVILVNGTLREGDTMLLAGTDGPIVTQIRSLLMPQPMKELRVKNSYIEYKEIKAAQGVKIAAKELEKAIAGLNLFVAHKSDEIDIVKEEVARELKSALSNIKLQERGVYVQASTLGSLEALLEFLRTSKIPVSGDIILFCLKILCS